MSKHADSAEMMRILTEVRNRLILIKTIQFWARLLLPFLPLAALAVVIDQIWTSGRYGIPLSLFLVLAPGLLSWLLALRSSRGDVKAALALDQHAQLKDRVSSACEFLQDPDLSPAQRLQVQDALQKAESLSLPQVLPLHLPRHSLAIPFLTLLLAACFFLPAVPSLNANTRNNVQLEQLALLAELQEELKDKNDPQLEETIKQLESLKKKFEKGELEERDLMLELGRMDEKLQQQRQQLGTENLEAELNTLIPHLAAATASREAAQALQEQKLDEAVKALEKLAEKMKDDKLTPEEKKQLAAHLGSAAAKLGKKKDSGSFSGDLAQATEALEKSDGQQFSGACKSMGQKLSLVKKSQQLKSACKKVGLCKAGLGQCQGEGQCENPGSKPGGKKAGSSTTGNPLGEQTRLNDSYKKMLQVTGQAGAGPVETETEITEGQTSQAQQKARELHADFAAVAEEVVEREDIPLSRRFHVKRYFQAIRPQE